MSKNYKVSELREALLAFPFEEVCFLEEATGRGTMGVELAHPTYEIDGFTYWLWCGSKSDLLRQRNKRVVTEDGDVHLLGDLFMEYARRYASTGAFNFWPSHDHWYGLA